MGCLLLLARACLLIRTFLNAFGISQVAVGFRWLGWGGLDFMEWSSKTIVLEESVMLNVVPMFGGLVMVRGWGQCRDLDWEMMLARGFGECWT